MELPLKVELPRLSHLHVLQLLLPFVPGIVVTVGWALTASSPVQKFEAIGLGYKMKLVVAVALAYIIGLTAMAVTETADAIVMRLLRREPSTSPWANSYWRRVATTYVGSELSPMNAAFSSGDLDRLIQYVASLARTPQTGAAITKYRESILELEKQLIHHQDTLASATPATLEQVKERNIPGVINQGSTIIQGAKDTIESIERKLRVSGVESEWHTLYQALTFLPADVYYQFGPLMLLMSSLQAAALGALWLMIQFQDLRYLPGMLFAVVLLFATTYSLWYDYKLRQFLTALSSPQIAAMIQDIQKRSTPKASVPETKSN